MTPKRGKTFATVFYHSGAWLRLRAKYIQSVHGLCEECDSPGYIVHHKVRLTPHNIKDPNITLNWNHLQYLCLVCHNRIDGKSDIDYSPVREGFAFNEYGDLIEVKSCEP